MKYTTHNNMTNNKGTTLLELMVSIAIFSSMILVVSSVFSNINTGQREAIATQNIQESVRYFMEVMSKEIRMARGDRNGYLTGLCNDALGLTNTNKKTFNFDSANNSVLYFVNKDYECVYYRLNNKRIEISRDNGANFLPITSKNIEINNLLFNVDDNDAGTVRDMQTRVTISFDVESKSDIDMHKNKMKIQTTISSRRYE